MVNRVYNFNKSDSDSLPSFKPPASPSAHQNIVLLVCIQGTERDRPNLEYHIQETFR